MIIWFHGASDFSQQIRIGAIASAIDLTSRTFDDLYQSYTWPLSIVVHMSRKYNGYA